jgi:adenylate cyclase
MIGQWLRGREADGSVDSVTGRARARLVTAFRDEERRGLALAATVRTVIVAALLIWISGGAAPLQSWLYDMVSGGAFLASGIVQMIVYWRAQRLRWQPYVFVAMDVVAIALIAALNNPFHEPPLPAPLGLREPTFVNLFVLLLQVSFSFRPTLVLWTGLSGTIAIAGATAWIATRPGVVMPARFWEPPAWQLLPPRYFDAAFVPLGKVQYEAVVFLCVAAGLALLVWRSRRLVALRTAAERARGNLARYFSPQMIDALERRDVPMGQGRRQSVVVLFADIVGFTGLAESEAPEEIMRVLQAFHRRMEAVIFKHGGCLERMAGDSLMASFGVPDPGPRDGADALACAREMQVELDVWNAARRRADFAPIAIGIGLHSGAAVLGDIGSERSMTFTVIGDTVNVASRLQALTREVGATLCASVDVIARARAEGIEARLVDDLQDLGEQSVRGREQPIGVMALRARR